MLMITQRLIQVEFNINVACTFYLRLAEEQITANERKCMSEYGQLDRVAGSLLFLNYTIMNLYNVLFPGN